MALQIQRTKRYQIAAPVTFWWLAGGNSVRSGKGITKNISSSGVLVAANECPDRGASIQMTIHVQPVEGSGTGMKLHGEGTVTRIEDRGKFVRGDGILQFAAAVQFQLEPEGISPSSRK